MSMQRLCQDKNLSFQDCTVLYYALNGDYKVTIYISIHPLNHLYVKAIQEMLKIKNDWI